LTPTSGLHRRLVLVSANVRHYARVVEVGYPLRVENWREAEWRRWRTPTPAQNSQAEQLTLFEHKAHYPAP
jgi:hypothetical protein